MEGHVEVGLLRLPHLKHDMCLRMGANISNRPRLSEIDEGYLASKCFEGISVSLRAFPMTQFLNE
jgi:hypothetical protein